MSARSKQSISLSRKLKPSVFLFLDGSKQRAEYIVLSNIIQGCFTEDQGIKKMGMMWDLQPNVPEREILRGSPCASRRLDPPLSVYSAGSRIISK